MTTHIKAKHIFSVIILFFIFNLAYATTYYVDYEQGSNKNSGVSQDKPLKNYPGDPDSSLQPMKLKPGDKVIFKGGVKYKGSIEINNSGRDHEPIIFDGNSNGIFGSGKAIIDGSDNLENIYSCKHPMLKLPLLCAKDNRINDIVGLSIFNGNSKLFQSSNNNINDPYIEENLNKYYTVKKTQITENSLKVNQASFDEISKSPEDAFVVIWGLHNQLNVRKIKKLDKDQQTIYFDTVRIYKNKDAKYTILNTITSLDQPGEYYFSYKERVLYIYPPNLENDNINFSVRPVGVNIDGDNIVFRNFIVEKNGRPGNHPRNGIAIKIYGNKKRHIKNVRIEDNLLRHHTAADKSGVITILHADNIQLKRNTLEASSPNRGILVMGSENVASDMNTINNVNGTGIAYFGVDDGKISNNFINNVSGVHANGISIYLKSNNTYVFNNCVANGLSALTTNNAFNTKIVANILHSDKDNYTFADWGGSNELALYNNIIMNKKSKALFLSKTTKNVKVVNSVIDGQISNSKTMLAQYNIYSRLSWIQRKRYGWVRGTNIVEKYRGLDEILAVQEQGQKISLPGIKSSMIGYPKNLDNQCKNILAEK